MKGIKFYKWLLVGLMTILTMVFVAGCGQSGQDTKADTGKKKLVVVTTPLLADMVHQISGDTFEVKTIIPAGSDPHEFVAKPQDLDLLKKADLVLYQGLDFEGKMEEALSKKGIAVTKDIKKDQIGTMEEDGKTVEDPHYWFDTDLYIQSLKTAEAELAKLEPSKKDMMEKNTKAYIEKLEAMKKETKEKMASIPTSERYLISPHDALNYFSRQYNIPVKAPQGVSTDTEVSNKEMEETAQFIADHKIKAIFAESTTDPARMEKLKEIVAAKGGNVKIVSGEGNELLADSLAPKGQKGDNYIDMMHHNVDLIVKYLK